MIVRRSPAALHQVLRPSSSRWLLVHLAATLHRRLAASLRVLRILPLCAALPGRADARGDDLAVPPPLAWHEPAPLARMFLQLPFEAPEVVPAGAVEAGLHLRYSNTLLVEETPALALDVHVETAQATVLLRYGLGRGVEAQLALPAVVDYGGFLDGPIEFVEGLFDAANPQRRGRPRNVARFQLTRPDGRGISRDGPGAGLGDVWGGLKVRCADQQGPLPALALRAALKLPTGHVPYGSGEIDVGGGLVAAWAWGATAVRFALDVLAPTESLRAARIATRPYGAVQAGLTRRLGERVALQLQASGHLSPLGGTGIGQIDGSTWYVLAGATVALSPSTRLEAGMVENVFSPYRGADFTMVVGLETRMVE